MPNVDQDAMEIQASRLLNARGKTVRRGGTLSYSQFDPECDKLATGSKLEIWSVASIPPI